MVLDRRKGLFRGMLHRTHTREMDDADLLHTRRPLSLAGEWQLTVVDNVFSGEVKMGPSSIFFVCSLTTLVSRSEKNRILISTRPENSKIRVRA
mmetsp:Transcript_912/g.2216  ORF Transcript_912/g.2216 Transcript_912/m.2216 type:complete len:94 (-) Transcript_912:1776-2057(-)